MYLSCILKNKAQMQLEQKQASYCSVRKCEQLRTHNTSTFLGLQHQHSAPNLVVDENCHNRVAD